MYLICVNTFYIALPFELKLLFVPQIVYVFSTFLYTIFNILVDGELKYPNILIIPGRLLQVKRGLSGKSSQTFPYKQFIISAHHGSTCTNFKTHLIWRGRGLNQEPNALQLSHRFGILNFRFKCPFYNVLCEERTTVKA